MRELKSSVASYQNQRGLGVTNTEPFSHLSIFLAMDIPPIATRLKPCSPPVPAPGAFFLSNITAPFRTDFLSHMVTTADNFVPYGQMARQNKLSKGNDR